MKLIRTACYLIALTATALAAEPPDFSGTWVMNPQKGENLGMAAAVQQTLVVTQTAEWLKQDFTNVFQGSTTTREVQYDLSGASVTNYAAMGDESDTVARWDGDNLVTTWSSEGAIAGTKVVRTETRWLSDDGDTMSVETGRDNRPSMIMVYDRRE